MLTTVSKSGKRARAMTASNGITVRNSQLYPPGNAPSYTVRAYYNFDGTSSLRGDHGNITSVSRIAVGTYTATFQTQMPGISTIIATCGDSISNDDCYSIKMSNGTFGNSTTSFTLTVVKVNSGGTEVTDADPICAAVIA